MDSVKQPLEKAVPPRLRSHATLYIVVGLVVCAISLIIFGKLVDGVSENESIVQFDCGAGEYAARCRDGWKYFGLYDHQPVWRDYSLRVEFCSRVDFCMETAVVRINHLDSYDCGRRSLELAA